MRRANAWLLIIAAVSAFAMAGCGRPPEKPTLDWHPTLFPEQKSPYGGYLAFKSLPAYFPDARIAELSKDYRYSGLNGERFLADGSTKLLVLAGFNFSLSDAEWEAMLTFIRNGNEVLLFASRFDGRITDKLSLTKEGESPSEMWPPGFGQTGAENNKVVSLATDSARRYGYTGRNIRSYFTLSNAGLVQTDSLLPADSQSDDYPVGIDTSLVAEDDTSFLEVPPTTASSSEYESTEEPETSNYYDIDTPDVLGYANGKPDFVRYRIGTGHLSLHAAPLVLSNYFLLQEGNKEYLNGIWQTMPAGISTIYWNVYYNHKAENSGLSALLDRPATRSALLLALITLLLYVLFSMRRLQRIVPIIPPVENASVSFVETVGRLYYNKRAHDNLAEKMILHFLEWVRTHYYLDTAQLSDAFEKSLAAKSGKSPEAVRSLMQRIHAVRTGAPVSEEFLNELYLQIQSFYHNHTS